jgi:uncharacterized protein (TIGR00645 family)
MPDRANSQARAERAATAARGGVAMRRLELMVEWLIFNSRWLLSPIYIGLALSLLLLLYHFAVEFAHFAASIPSADSSRVTLGVLGLVDLAFTANLVLIVVLSGYENFVSRIEAGDHDRPDWMTKVDFGGLKQKLMVSIVAISAIEVLKSFMNVDQISDRRLAWVVGIHVVFLFSMLVVALADRLSESTKPPQERASKPAGS